MIFMAYAIAVALFNNGQDATLRVIMVSVMFGVLYLDLIWGEVRRTRMGK